ncbi:type 1 glutamine amidotransferase domain-containing protein [Natrarchaeobius halalkaliphilus]|uniref:Type 1 glutamine amidotransferase domain-containing protein n=1 Tax=Natrarchaeobius halalkaliphilus TaxID=1679091 RepID=A0A3N6M2B0_9EURY|nr:type 1 glutamine amidotransferase domain-containing protein [Natrarchaeobius halalkaliphilus]RQG89940.1 type 1 glutamine amidotransferase domain-containing protein [Natrarchaeobius halalkaliphilus]
MTEALFVVSENGYWGEECTEPLETLSEAGVEITVATPSGGPPQIDEQSIDPDQVGEETASHVLDVHESDDRLNDPIPTARADAELYDAVVYPGGHGTEWDVNQDSDARRLLRETIEGDGTALVVCHAVGILAFARDSHGAFIVTGRDVTGFPNEWEEDTVDEDGRLPDGRKLPYWVEDEVIAAGGNWDAELESEASVTVDGDLITARGPESSTAAAETLREKLDR